MPPFPCCYAPGPVHRVLWAFRAEPRHACHSLSLEGTSLGQGWDLPPPVTPVTRVIILTEGLPCSKTFSGFPLPVKLNSHSSAFLRTAPSDVDGATLASSSLPLPQHLHLHSQEPLTQDHPTSYPRGTVAKEIVPFYPQALGKSLLI